MTLVADTNGAQRKVLFTGYAPVHFVCFQPLLERMAALPGVETRVSGGLRSKTPEGEVLHDSEALYAPFGLPPESVLTVEQIREMDFDLLFCANTKRIEPRSFGRSIEIFHGMSFRNKAVREENTGNDRYFVLGPYMMRRFREFGFFAPRDDRAVEVGFPKTDRLLDGSLDRDAILRAHGFSGERPVILYAPTGAKRNSLETMGEDLIRLLSATDDYDLLVKPHDHPKNKIDWFARLAPLEHAHLKLVRDPDVVPDLYVADLLISDASSVVNEYALLDRPIVFLDVPELLEAAGGNGSALDLETWGRRGGEVANNPVAAAAAVANCLSDPGRRSDVRAEIVNDLFYNPGAATDAAIEFLRGELSLA
jgi:CDP-glycerol:poly(glycerophosphate) glycerophosphotransferase